MKITLLILAELSTEHGTGAASSGRSTPFGKSGSQTPRADYDATLASSLSGSSPATDGEKLMEKLHRRSSVGNATLAKPPKIRGSSNSGPSQEHSEQGKVKWNVYFRYLEAASKTGFSVFLVANILQQAASVLANITLRNWGEHNREFGDNSGMFNYLLGYGLFSLSSVLLGGAAAILLWVFCAVRSARQLHDSVSIIIVSMLLF